MIDRFPPARGLAFVALLLAAACGPQARPPRAPFVAVWVDPRAHVPEASELEQLSGSGIGELFVEVSHLSWENGVPRIERDELPACARPSTVSLVIAGIWGKPDEGVRTTARAWRKSLDSLREELARRSCTVSGLHFEVESLQSRESLADVLERLRASLPGDVHLSVSLDPRTLAVEGTRELASSTDFLVATVWGQPPGEAEDGARWDLEETTRPAVLAIDGLGRPYALGAWTLGTAFLFPSGGGAPIEDETVDLDAIAATPGATFRGEALLQGIDRQVNEWGFAEPAVIGLWRVGPGDVVRVVRPATANLEEFLDRTGAWSGPRRIGTVLRRLPGPAEPLALSASNLSAAIAPGDAEPALTIEVVDLGSAGNRNRVRVVLTNRNDEATDFGGLDSNYVELRLADGAFGRIDVGQFDSWRPLWRDRRRGSVRALREADTLRLHAARVGGRQRIESGAIEFWSRGGPAGIEASGSFFLPGGRVLAVGEPSQSPGNEP